ncbi:MAG: S9 family peptidase [Phycisphaerales bacterium]|nr:S9 family peptidase [Phycisphaerales bacterium]
MSPHRAPLAPLARLALLAGFALTASFAAAQPTTTTPPSKPAAAKPAPAKPSPKAQPVDAELIPRDILFGNPDKSQARISPDGKHLAFIAPVNDVLNVFVAPASDLSAAKAITNDTSRGIRRYVWAMNGTHLLYMQDKGGDENWRVYSVNLASGETKDLTPLDKVAAEIVHASERFPDDVLIGLNDRDERWHDVYRVNVETGERTLVQQNDGFAGFTFDDDFKPRYASRPTASGGSDILVANAKTATVTFDPWQEVGIEDALTSGLIGLTAKGDALYMTDSRGRDTAVLKSIDPATGKETILAENPKSDAGGMIIHPHTGAVQAVSFDYDRVAWNVLDPTIQADIDALRKVADGDLAITSRSLDDKWWTVSYVMDNGPARTYLYDNTANKATFLFTNNKRLEGLPLVNMHPVIIKSRDGHNLVSYLSLPPGSDTDGDARPDKAVPLVLFVHGGPWGRDSWGYNPTHQWLANRGYAVLSTNFRASTGFGKEFVNAGMHQWGKTMHDDLVDSVQWAVDNKVAQKDKVAIFGGSYGGYAALAGVTFTPDLFACSVAVVAPSNLITLLNSIPPYWESFINTMTKHVGDHRTEEGRALLTAASPLTHVDKIKKPLLIGQGANDPRVKQAEADQIVNAMKAKNIPVTYVLYPDEGHGFARPPNRMSFNAVTEAFFAKFLGGRVEPIGDDFKGSSITVPTGAEHVPGLKEALAK